MSDRIVPIELCLTELKKHSHIQFSTLADYPPEHRYKSEVLATVELKGEALARLYEAKVVLDCLMNQNEDPLRISRMIDELSSYKLTRFYVYKDLPGDSLLEQAERALVQALCALRAVDFRPESERVCS